MPIYAYRCSACGHAKDALQKMSDAPLTTCPACGAEAFSKQVTAAGFQLKGSGWYVTPAAAPEGSAPEAAAAGTTATDTAKAATPAPAAASTDSGSGSGSSGTSSGGGASSTCH